MPVTQNDFEIWRNSEVGRWFFDNLQEEVNELRLGVGGGSLYSTDDSKDDIAIKYANMVGLVDGIQTVIERDPFYETKSDRPPSANTDGA